jgi:hypothetical protein
MVIFKALGSIQIGKNVVRKHSSYLGRPIMFKRVRDVQVIAQTPFPNSTSVVQLDSHTDVFVKLKIIVLKVTERDQWNNVISAGESSMTNSTIPFQVLVCMNKG